MIKIKLHFSHGDDSSVHKQKHLFQIFFSPGAQLFTHLDGLAMRDRLFLALLLN